MDTWEVICQVCGQSFKVEAHDERGALVAARLAHAEEEQNATMDRCENGPIMESASNLTSPDHPCAKKRVVAKLAQLKASQGSEVFLF